jgi:glycosyltransferase involved in cell wall biosynthesis
VVAVREVDAVDVTRRRIVLFTPGYTERNGGLARHSRVLAEGFAARGWQVYVLARAGTLRWPRVVREANLLVVEFPGFDRRRVGAALYLTCAVFLGAVWSRRAVGCLALHLGTTSVAAGCSAGIWRKPFLALSTSSGPLGEVEEALARPPFGLRRRILRRATYLVAQSLPTEAELHALTTSGRVAVVPNPVELPDPPPLDGRPLVLFLGRLSAEKNPGCLVEAWRRVAAERPDARLDFVGSGGKWRSVEDDLRQQVRADPVLAKTIRFQGWTDDAESAFAAHDIFVQSSSTFEGMSNSLLEACAHHRVVVASDIPQNRAVLGDDYPLLFRSADAADLADALLRAMKSNEVRAEAADRARAAVGGNAIARVVSLHEQLLTSRS